MLSYVENQTYFLSMEMYCDGNCIIILRKKIDENHGKRIYEHVCKPHTENDDFAIYYDLKERIENNTLNDEYVANLKR